MKTRAPGTNLREAIETLRPIVDQLREVERNGEGILRQLEGIPLACHGVGPETLLAQAQKRVDRRFRDIVGSPPPMNFTSPDRVRDLLHIVEQLAGQCGADVDTSPLPLQARFAIWTDDEHLYTDESRVEVIGGVQPLQRLRFAPDRELLLNDDGSLI